MNEKVFYLVWRDNASSWTPKHVDFKTAQNTADRLAAEYPGMCFYVLEARGYSQLRSPNPSWYELERT